MYFCEPPKRKGHPVLSMLCHRLLLNISIHADDGFAQRVDSHRERIHSALIAGSILRDFSLCQLKNTLIATAVRIVGHPELFDLSGGKSQLLISRAGSNGRCNTIWYKAVFKGGVYETRETVWAFGGAETRRVASLEGRADAA